MCVCVCVWHCTQGYFLFLHRRTPSPPVSVGHILSAPWLMGCRDGHHARLVLICCFEPDVKWKGSQCISTHTNVCTQDWKWDKLCVYLLYFFLTVEKDAYQLYWNAMVFILLSCSAQQFKKQFQVLMLNECALSIASTFSIVSTFGIAVANLQQKIKSILKIQHL